MASFYNAADDYIDEVWEEFLDFCCFRVLIDDFSLPANIYTDSEHGLIGEGSLEFNYHLKENSFRFHFKGHLP